MAVNKTCVTALWCFCPQQVATFRWLPGDAKMTGDGITDGSTCFVWMLVVVALIGGVFTPSSVRQLWSALPFVGAVVCVVIVGWDQVSTFGVVLPAFISLVLILLSIGMQYAAWSLLKDPIFLKKKLKELEDERDTQARDNRACF